MGSILDKKWVPEKTNFLTPAKAFRVGKILNEKKHLVIGLQHFFN